MIDTSSCKKRSYNYGDLNGTLRIDQCVWCFASNGYLISLYKVPQTVSQKILNKRQSFPLVKLKITN